MAVGVQYDLYGAPFDAPPETAIGTMMTDILEATVPGYVRPNLCELIQSSRFEA